MLKVSIIMMWALITFCVSASLENWYNWPVTAEHFTKKEQEASTKAYGLRKFFEDERSRENHCGFRPVEFNAVTKCHQLAHVKEVDYSLKLITLALLQHYIVEKCPQNCTNGFLIDHFRWILNIHQIALKVIPKVWFTTVIVITVVLWTDLKKNIIFLVIVTITVLEVDGSLLYNRLQRNCWHQLLERTKKGFHYTGFC